LMTTGYTGLKTILDSLGLLQLVNLRIPRLSMAEYERVRELEKLSALYDLEEIMKKIEKKERIKFRQYNYDELVWSLILKYLFEALEEGCPNPDFNKILFRAWQKVKTDRDIISDKTSPPTLSEIEWGMQGTFFGFSSNLFKRVSESLNSLRNFLNNWNK